MIRVDRGGIIWKSSGLIQSDEKMTQILTGDTECKQAVHTSTITDMSTDGNNCECL